jgi:hypothetical protein
VMRWPTQLGSSGSAYVNPGNSTPSGFSRVGWGDVEGLLVKVAGIESYKMTRCLRFAKPHQVSPITAVEGNDLSVMV